ncbi:hypothetical protein B0H14DRAFT_2587056 [Mycena olivaceomarginata]|nr:hypothetical protein B0H14DRAFT_2587056 [Mycena olivaceomarginata]
MPRSLFELPARVAVACSNCRDRKVKSDSKSVLGKSQSKPREAQFHEKVPTGDIGAEAHGWLLPSGWSDTTSPSPTTQYEFPTALTPSLHILPEGTDYWLPDHPPSPYHTPIYISKRRPGPPDIASDIQPEMYFTPPSFGFDIPTLYPINYEDYGWHGSSQMCQSYCACTVGNPCF